MTGVSYVQSGAKIPFSDVAKWTVPRASPSPPVTNRWKGRHDGEGRVLQVQHYSLHLNWRGTFALDCTPVRLCAVYHVSVPVRAHINHERVTSVTTVIKVRWAVSGGTWRVRCESWRAVRRGRKWGVPSAKRSAPSCVYHFSGSPQRSPRRRLHLSFGRRFLVPRLCVPDDNSEDSSASLRTTAEGVGGEEVTNPLLSRSLAFFLFPPSTRNYQNGAVQRGWCVGRYRLASRSFQGGARYASVTTRGRRQHGRLEEPARRAGDERLAFQMDELPERLPTEMVRPVKRPPVVLQVVSYVSSDPPTSPTSCSSRSTCRETFAILTGAIDLPTSSRRDRGTRDPPVGHRPSFWRWSIRREGKKKEKRENPDVKVQHGAALCRASRLGYVRGDRTLFDRSQSKIAWQQLSHVFAVSSVWWRWREGGTAPSKRPDDTVRFMPFYANSFHAMLIRTWYLSGSAPTWRDKSSIRFLSACRPDRRVGNSFLYTLRGFTLVPTAWHCSL